MSSSSDCHFLPCSIDYTGTAPIDIYFQPTPLTDDENSYYAAQFRGRGLLAAAPCKSSTAHVIKVINGNNSENTIITTTPVQRVFEWHHTHQKAQVNLQQPSRMQQAKEWCQIAGALHKPIDPPSS